VSSGAYDNMPRYRPFIAGTDVIGCLNYAKDFIVCGTASSKLFGVAESLWEPELVSYKSEVSVQIVGVNASGARRLV
jgi:hypothetical protein